MMSAGVFFIFFIYGFHIYSPISFKKTTEWRMKRLVWAGWVTNASKGVMMVFDKCTWCISCQQRCDVWGEGVQRGGNPFQQMLQGSKSPRPKSNVFKKKKKIIQISDGWNDLRCLWRIQASLTQFTLIVHIKYLMYCITYHCYNHSEVQLIFHTK